MDKEIQVLDYGYVRFVEAWGHGDAGMRESPNRQIPVLGDDYECGIIEAARQSTQGSFRGWETDEKLLGFLYNNKPPHATPFEFAGMIIEVKAPIFIFREWHRHRTQSYNEMSARYAPLPDTNYIPTYERLEMGKGTKNQQAAGVKGVEYSEIEARTWLKDLCWLDTLIENHYQQGLKAGIPKEVARIRLPVGRYSQMRAQTNLRNWLAFLTLRADPGAMWEIQQYANAVGQIIAKYFPKTWALYHQAKEDAKPENIFAKFTTEQLSAEIFKRTSKPNR